MKWPKAKGNDLEWIKGNPRARLFIPEQTAKECNVCFANERRFRTRLEVRKNQKRNEVAALMLEPAIMQNCTNLLPTFPSQDDGNEKHIT